jgi:peroxiredoxin
MSRFSRIFASAALVLAAASCSHVARIDGNVEQAASSEVIVKLLNVNRFEVLDTVAVDASGRFSYDVEVVEGQPEFVYLFHGDRQIASLLLSEGEKVSVKADTLGNWSVTGSEESVKLAKVEKDFAAVSARIDALASQMEGASEEQVAELNKKMTQEYINYYRDRVKYVMQNSKSLTVVPVFYQVLGEGLPVFGQLTDGIHFANICDSLETVYPASKYVQTLRKEAQARQDQLTLSARIGAADEIGFPDVILPNVKGEKIRLSDVDSKVILLQFWTSAEPTQKMFNQDILKPIYEQYHKKGLEIYQVALDPDKGAWAQVMKEQNLPWISVCDVLGASSPYALLYNIAALPATFIIADGELVDGDVVDEKSFRKLLDKLLK